MDCEWLGWCALKPEAQAAWVQAIGSIAAIFVAVGVAWWQAKQSRSQQRSQWLQEQEHRRVASRPHLSIEELTQREDPQLRIFIRNNGVGPAILDHFDLLIDGRTFHSDRAHFWQRFVAALELPPGVNSGGTSLADGQSIPAGAERLLLSYRPADKRQVDNEVLLSALARVDYNVSYKSVYGERFELRSRSRDQSGYFSLPELDS